MINPIAWLFQGIEAFSGPIFEQIAIPSASWLWPWIRPLTMFDSAGCHLRCHSYFFYNPPTVARYAITFRHFSCNAQILHRWIL
jgi:hypothetical protein